MKNKAKAYCYAYITKLYCKMNRNLVRSYHYLWKKRQIKNIFYEKIEHWKRFHRKSKTWTENRTYTKGTEKKNFTLHCVYVQKQPATLKSITQYIQFYTTSICMLCKLCISLIKQQFMVKKFGFSFLVV